MTKKKPQRQIARVAPESTALRARVVGGSRDHFREGLRLELLVLLDRPLTIQGLRKVESLAGAAIKVLAATQDPISQEREARESGLEYLGEQARAEDWRREQAPPTAKEEF